MKNIKFETARLVWQALSKQAWETREKAVIKGKTKVGCALYCPNGFSIYTGCNVEGNFHTSIHAEENAIGNMISKGDVVFTKCLIVAENRLFTPCGACMDWIMAFSSKDVEIAYQNSPEGDIHIYAKDELMPNYPQ